MPVDESLIRERCLYPRPLSPRDQSSRPVARYEWKFEDTHGNELGNLFWRESEGEWNAVFTDKVYTTGYSVSGDLAVMAASKGEVFRVFLVQPQSAPRCIFQSDNYIKMGGFSADGKYLLLEKGNEERYLHPAQIVIDLEGNSVREIAGHDGVSGCWAGAWSPVVGDYRVVIHLENSGYARPAIWYPLTGKVVDVPCDLTGEVWAVWGRDGKTLVLKRQQQGRSDLYRLCLADASNQCIQPMDGSFFDVSIDEPDRTVGFWSSSAGYARYFVESERLAFPEFKPSRPITPWDYCEIAGVPCFVAKPSGQKAPYAQTIFEVYGGNGYHHCDAYNSKIQTLVDHGFLVVLVNTRGCSGFGRAWRDASLTDIGHTELSDAAAVRQAMVDAGEIDPAHTIISGDSWGGYMTLLALGTQPELWCAGIAGEPVGDFPNAYAQASPLLRAYDRIWFGGSPETNPEAYRRASPLTYIDAVKAPVMIYAGKYDTRCPFAQTLTYVEALRQRGAECEFLAMDGAHGPPDRESRVPLYAAITSFALRHSRGR